jgi:glutamate carboxypeptidase
MTIDPWPQGETKLLLGRIQAAVRERRDALLRFLEQVVNIESPSEDKALSDRAGDAFQAQAERLGMRFERDRQEEYADNRIGRLVPGAASADAPRILMIGHFDTAFPAGTVAERPFRITGSRAYGPGVLDMKAGLTIGLFALEALLSVVDDWPLSLTLILNGDEEPGSPRSREVIRREAAQHDLALILEPGRPGPAITIGRKGVGIFRIVTTGLEAHAGADPDKGANSIVAMAHQVLAVQALNRPEAGTTVNPGVIHGGSQPYIVPGRSELAVDVRVSTAAEQERVLQSLSKIADSVHVPGTRSELSGSFHRPPMEATARTYEYVRLLQGVAEAMGYPLTTAISGGASDGNLTAALGVPTLDGLGAHGGGAHSGSEYVELASLENKCGILAGFLAALAHKG